MGGRLLQRTKEYSEASNCMYIVDCLKEQIEWIFEYLLYVISWSVFNILIIIEAEILHYLINFKIIILLQH